MLKYATKSPAEQDALIKPNFSSWMRIFWEILACSARHDLQAMAVALSKSRNAAECARIFQKIAERRLIHYSQAPTEAKKTQVEQDCNRWVTTQVDCPDLQSVLGQLHKAREE